MTNYTDNALTDLHDRGECQPRTCPYCRPMSDEDRYEGGNPWKRTAKRLPRPERRTEPKREPREVKWLSWDEAADSPLGKALGMKPRSHPSE